MSWNRVISGPACLLAAVVACAPDLPAAPPTPSEPQEVVLTTQDNVILHSVFYPGSMGKETVPIILLHGSEGPRGAGSGSDFEALAADLQKLGHAVLVPDLRGYGGSTMRRSPTGAQRAFYRDQLGARDLVSMVKYDVEAAKKFLMDRHNEGQLNIELLCVVGAELGAAVAANWAVQDWSWPRLPNLKQGQDVRALVLISPVIEFKTLSIQRALAFPPLQQLPLMIIYGGKDSELRRQAERVHRRAQRGRREPTLFLVELPTSLQGTRLLNPKLNTSGKIQEFVQSRVASLQDRLPWRPRPSL